MPVNLYAQENYYIPILYTFHAFSVADTNMLSEYFNEIKTNNFSERIGIKWCKLIIVTLIK